MDAGLTSNIKALSLLGQPSTIFVSSSPLLHSKSAPSALGRRHTVSMTLPLCQDDVETGGGELVTQYPMTNWTLPTEYITHAFTIRVCCLQLRAQ